MSNRESASYWIRPAVFPQDLEVVRFLFEVYQQDIGIDLCFQDFSKELEQLPGKYSEPDGIILLAGLTDTALACIALRPLEKDICEMKRLYVSPPARGTGLGIELCENIISQAGKKKYKLMRLDTLRTMKPAIKLYESLGFYEIDSYCHNPLAEARYFELRL
jgi:putative acetyltransferase